MPWKVSDVVNERMRFVVRRQSGERMKDLCDEFGITRKTGYKIWNRFQECGPEGLYDEPRRPKNSPQKTPTEIQGLVVDLRRKYPTWGPRKLKKVLEDRHPSLVIPAHSTISELLSKEGLSKKRRRRRRKATFNTSLRQSKDPNELWCADFKGQFRLQDQRYCYPLTISDHFSRFLIGCEGLESTKGFGARVVFEYAFRHYGLPEAIRTDNGAPFASTGLLGLSELSVWWLRLGIELERIEPGHPEQNGRHERMHLTLKQEATRPAGKNLLQQQEKLDRFQKQYNEQRPHEALGMKRPAEVYSFSKREYPEELVEPEYPLHDYVRRVKQCGHLRVGSKRWIYLSSALKNQQVGIREEADGRWLISFLHLDLGHYVESSGRFESLV